MKLKKLHILLLFFFIAIYSCKKDNEVIVPSASKPYQLVIPKGFPQPYVPEDNQLTYARVELGRKLFYDPMLSEDSSISCASCHLPEMAFTDGEVLSEGVYGRLTERNTPTVANIAYHTSFFWDGGNHSLELQVIGPLESEKEMNLSAQEAVERLKNHPEYPQLFKEAYKLTEPSIYGLTRAIAAFERTLISGNSPYDKYTYQGQTSALTQNEISGMNLFFSPALKCAECHTGFNFSNYDFENNGIHLNYLDSGRARITLSSADAGKFKVPSLRNVELTAPYMHDGSFATLSDVIDHYAQGGKGHPNQSSKISGFTITAQEKEDLISFLKALTDHEFLNNSNFKDPN